MTEANRTKPKRATLHQKIEVLDYMRGPPAHSQMETLHHFKKLGLFAISQATLSNWTTRENDLRNEFNKNPNLKSYRKKPVLKYPDITNKVEKKILMLYKNGTKITNKLIKDTYKEVILDLKNSTSNSISENKELMNLDALKLSSGLLKSFKLRNNITTIDDDDNDDDDNDIDNANPDANAGPIDETKFTVNENTPKSSLDLQLTNNNTSLVENQLNLPTSPASYSFETNQSNSNLDFNFDQIFTNNNTVGFSTRLIHSDEIFSFFPLNVQNNESNIPTTASLDITSSSTTSQNDNQLLSTSNNSLSSISPLLNPIPPILHSNNLNTATENNQILTPESDTTQIKRKLPFYPQYQNPLNDNSYYKRQKQNQNNSRNNNNSIPSKYKNPNGEKIEKILENITDGYVTLYNSGTSAIMGILSFINPKTIYIHEDGYKGTHDVIKLLNKLTGLKKYPLSKLSTLKYDQVPENSVIILESPMNPLGYVHDLSYYSNISNYCKSCKLIVDSTLAPPPLQFPFKHGADFIVYSAVKYLAGVSDLGAGFIVSKSLESKLSLHLERSALGTSIAYFDSFLLIRSLRTYKMRILTQCTNTENIIKYFKQNFKKYDKILAKIHHASLQSNRDIVMNQLNNYYNPVFSLELKSDKYPEMLLREFNFLSNNPNLEGGETLVELIHGNSNFTNDSDQSENNLQPVKKINYKKMIRFSIGCEDFQDIIRDIDQAMVSVLNRLVT